MNNNQNTEELKDQQAIRRDKKRKPRMRQHGRSLKKPSPRAAKHITKVERKRKKS